MTEGSDLQILFLKAVGAVEEGGLDGQFENLVKFEEAIRFVRFGVENKIRVRDAKASEAQRLKPTDGQYGVHMSHCYGLSDEPWAEGERFTCKYGEDDICPAALHEDPWAAYLEWEKGQKSG